MLSSRARVWLKNHSTPGVLRGLRAVNSLAQAYQYWVPYNLHDDGRAWAPTELTLDITYICNLKCEMCPQAIDFEKKPSSNLLKQYKSNKEMTTDQILKLMDDAAAFGVKSVTITGGEPFLRKDMLPIIERIKSRGMECQLLTNGMLINADTAARLVELGVEKITISVDGPADIHNKIRKHASSFERLIETVQMLQAEKKRQGKQLPYLAFSNTISGSNAGRLAELMDAAGQYGVNVNFGYLYYVSPEMEAKTARLLNPPVTGNGKMLKMLELEEVKGEDQNMPDSLKRIDPEVIGEQMKAVHEKGRAYGVKANFSPNLTPAQVKRRYEDDYDAYVNKCFYPWQHVRVNPYGEVYACGPISIGMGSVTKAPLAEIWNNAKFRAFRRKLRSHRLLPKCAKCCALNNKTWRYLPALRS
jgi:radical SAM protein with 4Fe4S-binding SPASM domain